MVTGRLQDFIREPETLEEIENPQNRLIMVIGGADTGKTTFISHLIDHLSRETIVAVADLDMGQSHLGPPTTIAWGKIEGGFKSWSAIQVEDFYFTGTLSPVGNLVPSLVGAQLITKAASLSCKKVIIDTTGLISEPAGRVLKQYKIDLIAPDLVLAIERSGELSQILDCFKFQESPRIHRIPVPDAVRVKTPEMRTRYRTRQLKPFFEGAGLFEVSLKDTVVRFTREPFRLNQEELKNRIISLRDERNRDITVGIIERVFPDDGRILIRTSFKGDRRFTAILIGMTKISL
ncbi:MAG: Clp1/GlmU family protein [Spirochaetota bacterium]